MRPRAISSIAARLCRISSRVKGKRSWLKNTKTVTSSDKLAAFKKHTKSELRTSLSHKQLTQIHMKKRQKLPSKLFLINHRYFTVPQ